MKFRLLLIAVLSAAILVSCADGGVTDDTRAPAADSEEPATDTAPVKDDVVPAPDFELTDQYGTIRRLSDYRGKVVFLNFWATWCPPCRNELPYIQALYEKYSDPDSEVVVMGVAAPNDSGEKDAEGIADFLADNGCSFPVVMDEGGAVMSKYYVRSFPSTFMIDRDGNVFGYVNGGLAQDIMQQIIDQTLEGSRTKLD